jgi:hypothetical protein
MPARRTWRGSRREDSRCPRPGVGAGERDAPLVPVDAGDLRHDAPQSAGERPLAAADVERLFATWRNGIENHVMVVQIVAPRLLWSELPRLCHAQLFLHRPSLQPGAPGRCRLGRCRAGRRHPGRQYRRKARFLLTRANTFAMQSYLVVVHGAVSCESGRPQTSGAAIGPHSRRSRARGWRRHTGSPAARPRHRARP